MRVRSATRHDLDRLAEWNHYLMHDEGLRNRMSISQFREWMDSRLDGDYTAVIFETGSEPVAYAITRGTADSVYIRHLFVSRSHRPRGFGRESAQILRSDVLPGGRRLTVDILTTNMHAVAFWRAVGFSDYCLTLDILP